MTLLSGSADKFFSQNLWWIILISVLAAIAIAGLATFSIVRHLRKNKEAAISVDTEMCRLSLGGLDNVIAHKREGSRIVLVLKDGKMLDKERLKKAGVTGFIEKSDKLTLVVKERAEELYGQLFGE